MSGLIQGIGIAKFGSGAGSSSANEGKQVFNFLKDQLKLEVTDFTLNEYAVFVDGTLLTSGYSNLGNVVTFTSEIRSGQTVVVIGIK